MTQEQWLAIRDRDSSYDGVFYYAAKRSDIVCRPSCRMRRCEPKNIIIFETLESAEEAGYRPCRRCCPEIEGWQSTKAELVKKLRSWIETNHTEKFSLDAVADSMHMDKNYLLRVFKEVTGTTMLHYHNSVRCEHAAELLIRPELSISYVGECVGFKTPSHFSRVFKQTMGRTPAEYRRQHMESFR